MKIFILLFIICFYSNNANAKHYLDFKDSELKGKKIALFGSFKCYDEFINVMDYFESKGGTILCPIRSKIIDINADFRLFKDDDITKKSEKELQQIVFDKTRKYANIVYIVNSNNCPIGLGTASEIGYTIALNDIRKKQIKIYCAEKPQSSHIRFFCEY